MSLRRVDSVPELVAAESLALEWSDFPHHPALSEATRLQLRAGQGIAFVSESPAGIATLTKTKRPEAAMVEVAVPSMASASDFWDVAQSAVFSDAVARGLRGLLLLTWDPELRSVLGDRGWRRDHAVNMGRRVLVQAAPLAASGGTPPNVAPLLGGEIDPTLSSLSGGSNEVDQLIEVNNLAFAGHPDAGNWDLTSLETLFAEPWFDPAGLIISRDGETITGFCWTKVHPDGVGEIYLLAVRPGQTGRGLGRGLATAGVEYLRTGRGCQKAIVYWDASDASATNLYQSIGFSVDLVGEVFRHRF